MADDQARPIPQEWEYLAGKWDAFYERLSDGQELDELGEEGWELVAATDGWLFFKRPLPPVEREE